MGGRRLKQIHRHDLVIDDALARPALPFLLTVEETADLLRTTRKGIYAMVERGQLPGVTRIGKRLLVDRETLLEWLRQKSAPSPERIQR
jgi:excisionase family DNA binding protein